MQSFEAIISFILVAGSVPGLKVACQVTVQVQPYCWILNYGMHIVQGKPQDRVAGGAEEFNAFFYSLVSTDTQVRQQHLYSGLLFGCNSLRICDHE